MAPKFADQAAWEQASILLQPVFIRLIDNLRKQLETSNWQGTYEDAPIWPPETAEEVKAEVADLQAKLSNASPEQKNELEAAIAELPQPYIGYRLCLQRDDQTVRVDLWELCFQICFQDYQAVTVLSDSSLATSQDQIVAIDQTLLDEFGEIDWHHLDQKAQQLVEQVFATLSA